MGLNHFRRIYNGSDEMTSDLVEPKALPQMALLNALHLRNNNDLQVIVCRDLSIIYTPHKIYYFFILIISVTATWLVSYSTFFPSLQDLLCSLILSECVYKAVDSSRDAALHAISTFKSHFPPGMVEITAVQFCRNRVSHRYLLATGGPASSRALYVGFMGTKELRDVAVDVALGPRSLFDSFDGGSGYEQGEVVASAAGATAVEETMVVAHGGFLSRAQGIPAASLLLHALKQNMRLVLCG
jgi:hypothetical protein